MFWKTASDMLQSSKHIILTCNVGSLLFFFVKTISKYINLLKITMYLQLYLCLFYHYMIKLAHNAAVFLWENLCKHQPLKITIVFLVDFLSMMLWTSVAAGGRQWRRV